MAFSNTYPSEHGNVELSAAQASACFHCGEDIPVHPVAFSGMSFCCTGCATVYQILNKHDLCDYYQYADNPGINQKVQIRLDKFAFLEDKQIIEKLLSFDEGERSQVIFYLPQIHCSSCLWLLEHLQRLNKGIFSSRVDFVKKEVTVMFQRQLISLRQLAELLASIGYEPYISLHEMGAPRKKYHNKKEIYKIGIAGFCFSNIMMLSLPEYFGLSGVEETYNLQPVFQQLIVLLSLPVLFYSATGFFTNGWKKLQQGFLNIDAPIALAIAITFIRSIYELVSQTGSGYLDSMSGIVFFMLAGRMLQDKTQQSLAFDRDYTSYFPIAINKIENGKEIPTALPLLKSGDNIVIYNNEIIPADGLLVKGKATIDYSFVTGESRAVSKSISDIIYAGGRQTAGKIELLLVKDVSQSYLTSLWNKESMRGNSSADDSFVHDWSKYFTIALFTIATATGIWWYAHDPGKLWPSVTAILIVACPCALLLSNSFTNGHIIRLYDRAKFYVRNASVVERICRVQHIVFDKTGTLTNTEQQLVTMLGDDLQDEDKILIASLAHQSQHPLSKAIFNYLSPVGCMHIEKFKETAGKGCEAWIADQHVLLGSPGFVWNKASAGMDGTQVAFRIDQRVQGIFIIGSQYRVGIEKLLATLRTKYPLSIISGDSDEEKPTLTKWAGKSATLVFRQSPLEKLAYIGQLQEPGTQIMMIGDGLNDAGALKQSEVGIAVTQNINNFSPACDAIMYADQLTLLPLYLQLAKAGKKIIAASFIMSICYNIAGLYFAMQGSLSPLIAAILMPASSISIVLFTWFAVQAAGRKLLHQAQQPVRSLHHDNNNKNVNTRPVINTAYSS